ncbi:MAG: PAS domain S-box protein, partial [Mariprofundaceae bacterium]|nr:PAS domain S-box protein [Mariprofundaceae bacterium]
MTVSIADILLLSAPAAQVGDSFTHAYQLMDEQGFNATIVMRDNKPLGVLSKDDMTRIQQQNTDSSQSVIQTEHVPSKTMAKLELSMPLQKAFDFLFDHQLRQLVIINEHGVLEGLLTLECVLENLSGKPPQHNIKHTPEISTETENYYKQLMHAIPEAVIIHHLDHILFANPASLELLAWDSEHDIVELPLMEFIHPDSQAEINQHINNLQQNPSKKLAAIEERLIRHDGKSVWVEMSCSISKHQGKTVVISVFRDVSRRKKAELESQLLKKTINTIQESIFITDPNGIIQYANQSFTRIMGYTAQEAVGKTPAILNSHQQSKAFYTHLWQTLKSGQPWSGRIMNRHKDGTIFPVYMSIAPMFNTQQEITHFVAVHEDLSHDEALQHKII